MSRIDRVGYGSAFNELFLDGDTITKQSINTYGHSKLAKEIQFYKAISTDHPTFPVPAIKSYGENSYSMTYMSGYIPLYTIFAKLDQIAQNTLLNNITSTLNSLHSATHTRIDKEIYMSSIKQEFYRKVLDRFEEIKPIVAMYNHIKRVNSVTLRPFHELVTSLYEYIARSTHTYEVARIHGDSQFNNILYNPENSDFVFIDPRGYWGTLDNGLGAPAYDHAKVLFALSGYDVFDNMVVDELHVEDGDNLILDRIFLTPHSPLKSDDIVTAMTLNIWLANAHCFKQKPLKAMYSYFYACYLATLYAPCVHEAQKGKAVDIPLRSD